MCFGCWPLVGEGSAQTDGTDWKDVYSTDNGKGEKKRPASTRRRRDGCGCSVINAQQSGATRCGSSGSSLEGRLDRVKEGGIEATLHVVEGAGHGVGGQPGVLDEIAAFFDKHLKTAGKY